MSKKKIREVTFGLEAESNESYGSRCSIDSENTDHQYGYFSPMTPRSLGSNRKSSSRKRLNSFFQGAYGLKCASGNEEKECFCLGDRKVGSGEVKGF